ncbi:hypothetical protein [Streptomyces griseus]|uniref:hypothetical protein n=1 Tax=Streptomyces griseus TaxID=1911 RepID=UPI0033DF6D4E
MSFQQPGQGGDKFDLKQYGQYWINSLMLVWPISLKPDFDSGQYEKTDVVEADIALVDCIDPSTGKPAFFKNAFIFSKGLVANTRGAVGSGEPVLGRLVKKQFANGVGWSLADFTPADEQLANQYMLQYPRQAPQQPATTPPPQQSWGAAPPADDKWAGTNAAPPAQQQWGAPAAPAQSAPPSAPAPPAQQSWGAPPAVPQAQAAPPPAPSAPSNGIAPDLVAFLQGRGIDVSNIPDQATAEMVAKSLG